MNNDESDRGVIEMSGKGLTGAAAGNHCFGSLHQNLQIEPGRAIARIAQIQANHVVESDAAAALHLPEPRDSRLRFEQTAAMPGGIGLHFVGTGGRGPTSDISPRSTLMNCGNSSRLVRRKKLPTGVIRGSLVSLKMPSPVPFVGCFSRLTGNQLTNIFFVLAGIVVDIHRTELQEREGRSVFSDALLPK